VAAVEVCEVFRLANSDPKLREAAAAIRDEFLRLSKSKNNLLPHEQEPIKRKEASKVMARHPLIPRFDIL
jgi:hypothetical protein